MQIRAVHTYRQARPNAVVGPPDYAVQMLHAQLFNVNTTCHNIPLGGSGSSVTSAVPRPLGLEVLFVSPPFSRLLRFNIGLVAAAYRGLLFFRIGLVERSGFSFVLVLLLEVFRSLLRSLLLRLEKQLH